MVSVCVFSPRLMISSYLMVVRMCFEGVRVMMLVVQAMLVRAVNFTISLHLIFYCLFFFLTLCQVMFEPPSYEHAN